MDFDAFETSVWDSINESLFTEQVGNLSETSIVVTIGETWQGALYGAEENDFGQRAVYLFDTETDQREWFDAVTIDLA